MALLWATDLHQNQSLLQEVAGLMKLLCTALLRSFFLAKHRRLSRLLPWAATLLSISPQRLSCQK